MSEREVRVVDDASIVAVTVHRSGSTVERRVTVKRGGGWPAELSIVGLPLALSDATARVRVAGVEGAGAAFAGDPHVGLYARPAAETVEPPTEAALRDARRAVKRTERAIAQREAELSMLAAAGIEPRPEPSDGRAPPPSPMQARLALVEFTDTLGEARHDEIEGLRATLGEQREALARLEDEARRASAAQTVDAAAVTKELRVGLSIEGEVDAVELAVSYYVPGARWVPAWQVRLDRAGRAASIEMRAHVAQRTGEDWTGVRLTVSTADPVRFTALPTLRSIRIGKAQAPSGPTRGFRPPPRGAEALFADFDRDRASLRARAPRSGSPPSPSTAAVPETPVWAPIARVVGYGKGMAAEELVDAFDDEGGYDEMPMASAGAPPPPPMRAAPAPSAPRGRAMRKRSADKAEMLREEAASGFGGALGGSAAGGGGAPRPSALDFAALRLPAPDSGERGKLVAVEAGARYREGLSTDGRRLSFDPVGAVQAAELHAAAVARMALPGDTRAVEDTSGLYDHAWTATATVDVPADGGWHALPLSVEELPCALRYVVVPRESTHVFRLAALQNPGGAPLLGGPVEVYVDDTYVLSTRLPTVPGRGRFDLGLGVEQGIRCARNTRFEELRSDARVVAMTELRHTIDVELVNRLGTPADIEVRERIPQPAEGAEVVVEESAVEPPWQAYPQLERGRPLVGGRRWRVEVAPGESAALSATYVVKIYAANELVGGNRREA